MTPEMQISGHHNNINNYEPPGKCIYL